MVFHRSKSFGRCRIASWGIGRSWATGSQPSADSDLSRRSDSCEHHTPQERLHDAVRVPVRDCGWRRRPCRADHLRTPHRHTWTKTDRMKSSSSSASSSSNIRSRSGTRARLHPGVGDRRHQGADAETRRQGLRGRFHAQCHRTKCADDTARWSTTRQPSA